MSSSTVSSSSSSAALETSSLLRLSGTGLYSGLDTDGIIKKLTAGTRNQITVQQQLEQKTQWKRDEYRTIESMLEEFQNTYLSYTSNTNFLSSSFFENTTINSSSDAVKATGSAADAANISINDISQLASAASFSSTHRVSNENITSGTVYNTWTPSNVGGKSLQVNYKGTDYTLTMSYSVQLDSENTTTADDGSTVVKDSEIKKVVDGLNDQIDSNSAIKGKFKFSYDDTNSRKISLQSTDSSPLTLKAYKADDNDTSGIKFLQALGFSGGDVSGTNIGGISPVDRNVDKSGLFNKTISSASYLKLHYNNKDYTVDLGENIDISGAGNSTSTIGKAIADQINSRISSDASLSGLSGVTATANSSTGAITFSSGIIDGGSQNLLNGLFTSQTTDGITTTYTSKAPDSDALTRSYLGDTLAGSSVTFDLNGVKKAITFDADDESKAFNEVDGNGNPVLDGTNPVVINGYTSADGVKAYLQKKLNDAFGTRTITVGTTDTGRADSNGNELKDLTFETAHNSVLELSASSDSLNVLSDTGALRINVGETNRAETSKTLEELNGELSTSLKDANGNFYSDYKINVNGKDFSFTKDTTLGEVMSTINGDSAAGVTLSYSQTLNTFRVMADDTGSQGKVDISDTSGNLAKALFGATSTQIDTTTTLSQISGLTAGSDGQYTVNLKDAGGSTTSTTFSATQNLSDVISSIESVVGTINDSNVTDADGGGNLANIIKSEKIGEGSNYSITSGKDLKMNVTLNGTKTDITRSANDFTLDGLTLQVSDTFNYNPATHQAADASQKVTFSSENNTDDLNKNVVDFVNSYNKIIKEVYTQVSQTPERNDDHKVKYQPLTDDQKKTMTDDEIKDWNTKAKKGLLQNDDALNSILTDMDNAMSGAVSSVGMSLSQLGISSASTDITSGQQFSVDTAKLKQALSSEPEKVKELFTNTDGISQRLKKVLTKNISTSTANGDGALICLAGKDNFANDKSELSTQIKSYESRITDLNTRLKTEEDRYWDQFTSMEQALSTLTAQSDYLASMSAK